MSSALRLEICGGEVAYVELPANEDPERAITAFVNGAGRYADLEWLHATDGRFIRRSAIVAVSVAPDEAGWRPL